MRTPSDEARRIVDDLAQQMLTMPEKLRLLPDVFFMELCAAEDIAHTAAEIEQSIAANVALASRRQYLLSVFLSCVHAAACIRLPQHRAWPAVMDAQRHAGVALAHFVSLAEASEVKKARARHAKNAQTKANDTIRLHVLDAAARSMSLKTPSSAAANIAKKLDNEPGGLVQTLKNFKTSLKVDSVERVFAGYIRKDVDRLMPLRPGERLTQSEKQARFEQWKKLYVCPAND